MVLETLSSIRDSRSRTPKRVNSSRLRNDTIARSLASLGRGAPTSSTLQNGVKASTYYVPDLSAMGVISLTAQRGTPFSTPSGFLLTNVEPDDLLDLQHYPATRVSGAHVCHCLARLLEWQLGLDVRLELALRY